MNSLETKAETRPLGSVFSTSETQEDSESVSSTPETRSFTVAFPPFAPTNPETFSNFSIRPSDVSDAYQSWAKLDEISSRLPEQGLLECRAGALIAINRDSLIERMKMYFDENVLWEDLEKLNSGLTNNSATTILPLPQVGDTRARTA